jgi:hypothetical protein
MIDREEAAAMAYDPYGDSYGGMQPAIGSGVDPGRDGIVQALMQQANPPPGNGAPGVPNNLSAMPDMQALGQGQQGPPAPGVASPQGPPGYGTMPPAAPMMGLPGIMQPGQLPMGMNPQSAAGGSPPLPMPPRPYG